jgi:hypothetical protein
LGRLEHSPTSSKLPLASPSHAHMYTQWDVMLTDTQGGKQ